MSTGSRRRAAAHLAATASAPSRAAALLSSTAAPEPRVAARKSVVEEAEADAEEAVLSSGVLAHLVESLPHATFTIVGSAGQTRRPIMLIDLKAVQSTNTGR